LPLESPRYAACGSNSMAWQDSIALRPFNDGTHGV
jgi:hypothetical protein